MHVSSVPHDWRQVIGRIPPFTGVLMCPPEHFAVIDEKNVFMRGQLGAIDRRRAAAQWQSLADEYRRLGVEVHVLRAEPGREDMVFTANGAVLLPRAAEPDGVPRTSAANAANASGASRRAPGADAVLSCMNHASRQAEVPHLQRWLAAHGIVTHALPAGVGHLEGHGDVLVVPGRRLLLGGHGGRSSAQALAALAALLNAPLVPLALRGDVFYHLDTCLALLDEDTLLLHSPAFHPAALERLAQLFPQRIEADAGEARTELACNAHALRSGHVLLPASAPRTAERLADHGFSPVPVDVSEFHKSGGSVFCMKLELPALA